MSHCIPLGISATRSSEVAHFFCSSDNVGPILARYSAQAVFKLTSLPGLDWAYNLISSTIGPTFAVRDPSGPITAAEFSSKKYSTFCFFRALWKSGLFKVA
ncbi:hypothetical protein OGATHE_002810 [Ogataea polymorpha]|uniref:Uncharacterized protein n=1 Tax=Ogataea polymorpha TaxID=460523 RepID=A0A9P8PDR9_9ASCO|nr:hypothetical protein OGATHE_002810 [Ogataea polymorpha]